MVDRVLLIVNRTSGTGCAPALPAALMRELQVSCGSIRELEMALVNDHPAARQAAGTFLAASDRPAAVIAAGGGGTLRAAVEGVCDASGPCLPAARRVVVGALRMGSGNVVARRLGIPRNPIEGAHRLGAALRHESAVSYAVIRARFGADSGAEDVRHAVTMCGLGQWGRCSGDLARWHRRLPQGRAAVAAIAGLERANHIEYACAAGIRLLQAVARPAACERVEVTLGEGRESFRLLAGAVMNFPIAGIPFDPQVTAGDTAAGVILVPRGGRQRRFRLGVGDSLRIRLLDRESVEFFLDEDPEVAHGAITLELAGALAFLPGRFMEVAS